MKNAISENVILFDWLTVSCKEEDPWYWVTLLHMEDAAWSAMEKGRNGYRNGLYFGSISILYDGNPGMGICLDMSGQGCRTFEEYGSGDFIALFRLFSQDERFHITRLDVAFDDHSGILDIRQLFYDTDDQGGGQQFVSKFRKSKIEKSFKDGRPGISIYHGSEQSDIMIRIYDKAAERGFTDGRHWVRVELQLRDKRAEEFLKIPMRIGEAFAGVLLNYLRFVEPDTSDSNKSRWKMTDYWAALVGDIGRIKIFTVPGGAYNAEKCRHYVFDMAGNAIDAMLQMCDSVDDFLVRLYTRRCRPNPKYEMVVKEYHARQEAFAEKVRQYFAVEDEPEEL